MCGRSNVGKESSAYSELDEPRRQSVDTSAGSCTHCGTEAQSECATILCANPMRTEYERWTRDPLKFPCSWTQRLTQQQQTQNINSEGGVAQLRAIGSLFYLRRRTCRKLFGVEVKTIVGKSKAMPTNRRVVREEFEDNAKTQRNSFLEINPFCTFCQVSWAEGRRQMSNNMSHSVKKLKLWKRCSFRDEQKLEEPRAKQRCY